MQMIPVPDDTPFGLCRLIGQTRAQIVLGIEQAFADAQVELNFSQFLALKKLGDNANMGPGELARVLNYNPGALTRLLDKLEKFGYLERGPDPDDRRALRLELTASGRAIRERMIACGNAAADRVFARFTRDERRELHGLMLRVLDQTRHEREQLADS